MFIYIFDDGQCCQSEESPTETDLVSIEEGSLQVLHIIGNKASDIGFDGVYCPLGEAILADVGGDICHIPEEDFEPNDEEEG